MRTKLSTLALALFATVSLHANAADLMDIYKEALQKDTKIQQAKAEANSAKAGLSQATAALLPQIDVIGSLTKTRTNFNELTGHRASNKKTGLTANLSQSLWRHSNWTNRSIAEKNAAAKDLAYADAMQNLIVRVCNAYFNVLNASDKVKFEKANNLALKRQLDEADRRLQVGLIAETDKLEAQAAYDLSSAAVIAAENELINSYEEIRLLIGRPLSEKDLAELDTDKFSTPAVNANVKELIKKAEENNLSIQQTIIARDIAKAQITVARSGHEPTLDLNASISTGYTRYTTEDIQAGMKDGNEWAKTIGLTLTVPIFHGGATSAEVDKAQAQYVMASEALEMAHRKLISNVNNSLNNVNASISSVKAYSNSAISAKSALNATIAGYDVGTRTMTDVLNATQNVYNAMQKASAARYQYIVSRLSLLYAQGDLKVEHVDQINAALKK